MRRHDDEKTAADAMARRLSRADALKRVAQVTAAAGIPTAVAVSLPERTSAAPSPARDRRILNFLLLLEYVQAGLYAQGVESRALTGEIRRLANVALPQERAHVATLRRALGASARKRPALDFGEVASDSARFARAALDLEETTAAAYIGQGANLTARAIVEVAGIVSVEARHAAWLRDLLGRLPAPLAADRPRAADDVLADLKKTGFVVQ